MSSTASASVTTPSPPASLARAELLRITWPMLAEMLLMNLMGLLGLWLVSRISDEMTAIFAMVNHIIFSFMMLFRIISLGAGVVVAQHLGGRDETGAKGIAQAALACNTWIGLVCAALLALCAELVLRLMQMPAHLLAQAVPYLQVMAICLCFDAGNFIYTTVLRSYKLSSQTMKLSFATQLSGLALALPLMHGWWGLPVLGLWGLIIGNLASRSIGWCVGLWLWRRLLQVRMTWATWWQWQADAMRSILRIGLPGAGEGLAYRISFMMIVALVAGMGSLAMSTHSYTFQIMSFILLFSLVVGLSTEIVVGHAVGAGQLHQADQVVKSALRLGLMVSAGLSLCMAVCGPLLLALFTHDEQIIRQGSLLLWLCLLVEPGRCFNLIVINGLRASGDVRFPLMAGVFSMFAVAVGCSWLLGVHWGWGLPGLWLAYAMDEWLRGLIMYARWRSRIWRRSARQVHRDIRRKRRLTLLSPLPSEANP